jgi:hypothetical protein
MLYAFFTWILLVKGAGNMKKIDKTENVNGNSNGNDSGNDVNQQCSVCKGTGELTYWGIFIVYLMAAKLSLFIIIFSLLGVIIYTNYFYLLTFVGVMLPFARADFRLYLYPVAVLAKLFGRKLNCPRCNPQGTMFKNT